MDISLFDYHLPKELIAQEPVEPRDLSRLLILNRKTGAIEHRHFYDIINYLSDNDVLVFNDSKVVPARLKGEKIDTKGKVEILLIRPKNKEIFDFISWPNQWIVIGKPELKKGQIIRFGKTLISSKTRNKVLAEGEVLISSEARNKVLERSEQVLISSKARKKVLLSEAKEVLIGKIEKETNYERVICFNKKGQDLKQEILSLGEPPLPPYITKPTERSFSGYQTMYAEKEGSIAAPTAGFHFTKNLLDRIREKGIKTEFVTLYVGLGTFLPVKTQEIEKHQMHSEFFELSKNTAKILNQAKSKGKRIIAIGTTTMRVLESCAVNHSRLKPQKGWTNLFIFPGYKFKFVDALITNFHLPKSTLLILVCAFASKDLILKAYQEAIDKKYRFFSFGDAMMIM